MKNKNTFSRLVSEYKQLTTHEDILEEQRGKCRELFSMYCNTDNVKQARQYLDLWEMEMEKFRKIGDLYKNLVKDFARLEITFIS